LCVQLLGKSGDSNATTLIIIFVIIVVVVVAAAAAALIATVYCFRRWSKSE